jgi:hypothetical protein
MTVAELKDHLEAFGDHHEVRIGMLINGAEYDRGIADVTLDGFSGAVLLEGKME